MTPTQKPTEHDDLPVPSSASCAIMRPLIIVINSGIAQPQSPINLPHADPSLFLTRAPLQARPAESRSGITLPFSSRRLLHLLIVAPGDRRPASPEKRAPLFRWRSCEATRHSRHLAADFVTSSACSAVQYVLPAARSHSRLASAPFPSEEEQDAVSSLQIDTPRARSPSTRTSAKDPARRSPSSQSSPLITAHAPHAVACKVAPH